MRRRRFVAGAIGTLSALALAPDPARAGSTDASTPPMPVPVPVPKGWHPVPAPGSTPPAQLRRIAAAGPALAWAVGEEQFGGAGGGRALAMTWDGSAWSRVDLMVLELTRLSDVAGVDAGFAWSVGQRAGGASALLRWDGTTWREAAFPGQGEPDLRLYAVAVSPARRVWVAGLRGGALRLLHGDGNRWRWLDPLPVTSAALHRVVWRAPGDVWVCGDRSNGGGWNGLVARWNGSWSVLPPITGLRLGIGDVHADTPDDVWAVGTEAGVGGPPGRPGNPALAHWDGVAWTRPDVGFTVGALSAVAADARGRAAWISGWNYQDQTRSTYLRRDGTGWTVVRGPQGPAPAPYLHDITRIPGTGDYWSAGMTRPVAAPPTEAYTERFGA